MAAPLPGCVVQHLPAGSGKGIGPHGLDADLVRPGVDGLLYAGGDPVFQFREELILLVDGQGQEPVQEARAWAAGPP